MNAVPRIAFFTDSYHQVNGVALTSRQLEDYARRQEHPFLMVRAGNEHRTGHDGSISFVELKRSHLAFPVDRNLYFDPLFARFTRQIQAAVSDFRADLIHVTSPGDMGLLGAIVAYRLGLPLVGSWHTNIHEFGARRLDKLLTRLPGQTRTGICRWTEAFILHLVMRFYRLARVNLAPNEELADLVRRHTGRPTFLMRRGVDIQRFSPGHRTRHDGMIRLGFTGRLEPEKNVRFLATLAERLRATGQTNFRFLIVGDGSERPWLERHLAGAEFTGVLLGDALAAAYADMDIFVFPSRTDTFGNVVLEAQASGVPVVVTAAGGPRFLVRDGETGRVAADESAYVEAVGELLADPWRRFRMSLAAREHARTFCWDQVMGEVYAAYEEGRSSPGRRCRPNASGEATPAARRESAAWAEFSP